MSTSPIRVNLESMFGLPASEAAALAPITRNGGPKHLHSQPFDLSFSTTCWSFKYGAAPFPIFAVSLPSQIRLQLLQQSANMTTQARNLFHHLPPPAECLALVIGTLELLPFGIIGLRNPAFFADGYGLPISNTPRTDDASSATKPNASGLSPEAEQQTKKALVAAIAARNMQNGILLLTFGLVLRDRRSLGVAVMAGLVATVADTVIVRAYGVKDKIAGHYVGIFNSLAIGGSLLYWGRHDPLW